jgi:hypothetical protein
MKSVGSSIAARQTALPPDMLGVSRGTRRRGRYAALSLAAGRRAARWLRLAVVMSLAGFPAACASDHADPIDPFNWERLEGGITDLFAFPVLANGEPAFPYQPKNKLSLADPVTDTAREPLTDEQRAKIDSLVIILCVRRELTQTGSLKLEPYTYRIHLDLDTPIEQAQQDPPDQKQQPPPAAEVGYHEGPHPTSKRPKRPTPHEAFLRYGGSIERPEEIGEEIVIEFRLDNMAQLQAGFPKYLNDKGEPLGEWDKNMAINVTSGVFDDPFIFPAFFTTNIVGMVIRIPMSLFPANQSDFLIWATSHAGRRQIDHVGRSLRTQNPRFGMLNTLHPRDHVKAIIAEHTNPSLMRDIFLRFNFASFFAYRRWDFVPDVMIYSTRYPVGFPNGRLLTDDVAAILAQYGDTLLYELAYQHNNDTWPRQTKNDLNNGEFREQFPYLLEPQPDRKPPDPLRLTTASRLKLLGIALALVALFVLENWIVARWYHRRKLRRTYL